jgi:threonine dehydrogenase-like Zn-dependent dehydrogenase
VVINSKTQDLAAEVRKICPAGVDFTVDAVGKNEIINQSMELLAPYGHICCYGISSETRMELDWSKAPYNWHLDFNQWPSKQEESESHRQVLSWMAAGVLQAEAFISSVYPFERIIEAFEQAEHGRGMRKTIITFD